MKVTFEKFLNDAHYGHSSFLKIQQKPTATMLFILTKRIGEKNRGLIRCKVWCVSGHQPSVPAPHPKVIK